MCGRFNQRSSAKHIAEAFEATIPSLFPEPPPRYNIAPTQSVVAVRSDGEVRSLVMLRWGLVPSWSGNARDGYKLIFARAVGIA